MNQFEAFFIKVEAYHKWMTLCRLCKENEDLVQYDLILKDYNEEVIVKRNLLAHAVEKIDEEGNKTLENRQPGKDPYIFNDTEAIQVRNDLRKYSEVLTKVIESF